VLPRFDKGAIVKRSIRKTKIVATVGPASRSVKTLERLLRAGVDTFRINTSHGLPEEHLATIDRIRRVADRIRIPCGILVDLQGPKIRTGKTVEDAPVMLERNRRVTVTTRKTPCTADTIFIDYPKLITEMAVGAPILINDGAVALRVESIDPGSNTMRARVEQAGVYASKKGVNVPQTRLSVPALTLQDKKICRLLADHPVEYLALSFVRSEADVRHLRTLLKRYGVSARIIAKIEKPEAAHNVEDIIAGCDGIMVARGDLGVETSVSSVPVLQKEVITRANRRGKQVIVATQMLESMITHAQPTRAEASDVANAVLDGTDAVMLSGETAVGDYPVSCVKTMGTIINAVEESPHYFNDFTDLSLAYRYPPHTVCEAAAYSARDMDSIPVCVFTMSGDTAFYLAKIRCPSPVCAFSPDPAVVRTLSLAWNVRPFYLPECSDVVSLYRSAESILRAARIVGKGDYMVLVHGTGQGRGRTNSMRIKQVGVD